MEVIVFAVSYSVAVRFIDSSEGFVSVLFCFCLFVFFGGRKGEAKKV